MDLIDLLETECELADTLCYHLDALHCLLKVGLGDHLARAVQYVDQTVVELRWIELVRALEVSRLADQQCRPIGATLADLADVMPADAQTRLAELGERLARATAEIERSGGRLQCRIDLDGLPRLPGSPLARDVADPLRRVHLEHRIPVAVPSLPSLRDFLAI